MERVRVFGRDREPVDAEVYRVVNVAENPELREAALRGTLHRLDDGEVIDVPSGSVWLQTPSSWWPSSSGTSSKPCPLRLYTASPTRRFRLIARFWLGFVRCRVLRPHPGYRVIWNIREL